MCDFPRFFVNLFFCFWVWYFLNIFSFDGEGFDDVFELRVDVVLMLSSNSLSSLS